MHNTRLQDRRRGQRIEQSLSVTFSINGGPEIVSDTINFTLKSLAIRSNAIVVLGDTVRAAVDGLPPVKGRAARIWQEGFAVALCDASTARAALAAAGLRDSGTTDRNHLVSLSNEHDRIVSDLIPLTAANPSWMRLESVIDPAMAERHQITFITTAPLDPADIMSFWVRAGPLRWPMHMSKTSVEDGKTQIVIKLNDWFMRMAERFDLSITIVLHPIREWSAETPRAAIRAHLAALPDMAV